MSDKSPPSPSISIVKFLLRDAGNRRSAKIDTRLLQIIEIELQGVYLNIDRAHQAVTKTTSEIEAATNKLSKAIESLVDAPSPISAAALAISADIPKIDTSFLDEIFRIYTSYAADQSLGISRYTLACLEALLPVSKATEVADNLEHLYLNRWIKRYKSPVAHCIMALQALSTICSLRWKVISTFFALYFGYRRMPPS